MSKLDYQNDSVKLGIKRLKLLGKHSELIMQSYYGGEIDELLAGEPTIHQLEDADIVWRPDQQSGLKLTDPIRNLVVHLLKDERRRKVNTEVGDFHESIRHLVGQINKAQQQGQFNQSNFLQNQLAQEVDDLNSRIATGIKSLWHRLNTGFAFVDNLADKIHENEKASKEVSRWLSGLEQIDFNELIQLAGSHAPLRNLLVRQLQSQVSEHFGSLREVQKRLGELLVSFRQQHERNLLVRSVVRYFEQNPNFKPSDYAQRSHIPNLVNIAQPIHSKTAFSFERHIDEDIIRQLVQGLPAKKANNDNTVTTAQSVVLPEITSFVSQQRALQDDVENFFIACFGKQRAVSAIDYLAEQQLPWEPEIWLYQVIAEYQSLPIQEKKLFQLSYEEKQVSLFNQLLLVEDLHLTAR